ncbi:protein DETOXIFICATION 16-like [Cucumis melo var. makuwa]|uniref:Protein DETOXIFICATION n=1 Tax=Cucumis melo var. makuwa TaxID=1194695 RepID=A0A5D3DYF8_CUCMM|nr:protein DETOXIFICATION 16-like [Cucumis melo var. makuwa]
MVEKGAGSSLNSPLLHISEDGLISSNGLIRANDKLHRRQQVAEELKRQLWLAGPLTLVGLLQYSLQMISVVFIGHLGELPLSGASVATSFATVTGFSLLMGMASALDTFCGQSYGAKQYHMLGIHMQRAMLVLLLVSVPLAVIWANTGGILKLLGQDAEIATEAGKYAICMIPTLFAYGLLQCLNRFLQTQNVVLPMVMCSATAVLLHIPIYSLLHVPSLGQAFENIPTYLRLAIPSACMVCLEMWSFELMVILSGLLPNPKLETSKIGVTEISLFVFHSVSTRVSNELGAGHPAAAKLAGCVVMIMVAIQGMLVGTFFILIRNVWGYAFSNEREVVEYLAKMLPIVAVSEFFSGLQNVLSGIARGCGWQKIGAFVNLGSYYIVGVPFGILLAFVFHIGEKGLWFGIMSALIVQACSLGIIAIRTNWDQEAKKATKRVYDTAIPSNVVS